MAKIPEIPDPTLAAVDAAIVASQDTSRRGYLGASSIGQDCVRRLWYSFRWVARITFGADTLKRFEDGHRGEVVMAARLSMVDGLMMSTETDTGEQWGFSALHGHFRGHCDGFIKGLLQAPSTPHVWEHKTCNETKQKKLAKLKHEKGEKEALAHWDPVYYAQAQVYMHQFCLTRHYLTCSSPGERTTVSVRTNYNEEHAEAMMDRARDIIIATEAPTRLTEQRTDYRCKICDFHRICHDHMPMDSNCRTCENISPEEDGNWVCSKHGERTLTQQEAGCRDYIPLDVPF